MTMTLQNYILFPLVVHFLEVSLIIVNPCVCQNVRLFTKSDIIVLKEENVTLVSSVSDTPPEQEPTVEITYENGTKITSSEHGYRAEGYTVIEGRPIPILRDTTFLCFVSWPGFSAVTNLTIAPLPNELSYCETNYTNGIIVGQMLTLTCFSFFSKTMSLMWNASHNEILSQNVTVNRTMTVAYTIYIKPSESQNGTIFTCEHKATEEDEDHCSVGPVYVYDEVLVFINPVKPAPTRSTSIIHPGESRRYICSSSPSSGSFIQWNIPDSLEGSGVELSVVDNMINVIVTADSTFTGEVELNCSANILDVVTVETLAVKIIQRTTTPTSWVGETNSPAEEDPVLLIAIGVSAGILTILIMIVISVLICLNRKSNNAATIKPESKKPADLTDREYEIPPIGSTSTNGTNTLNVSVDIHSVPERDSQLLYSQIGERNGGKEMHQSDSRILLPSISIRAEATVSLYESQMNGGVSVNDELEAVASPEEQDDSVINRDGVAVVYSTPNKKPLGGSSSNIPKDEEEDSSSIPNYSVVKKRH